MHGGDQNNAVLKATKDAIHHCCMAGISEIFKITDRKTQAYIKADIYAPHPEEVDPSVVTDYLGWWNIKAEVHQGGANPEGIAYICRLTYAKQQESFLKTISAHP